jgi:nucleotide-binding universal stress UspA family protein
MQISSEDAVVVGIDGSSSAVRAGVWAAGEASRRQLPLGLVHVYTVPRTGLPRIVGSLEQVREGMAERGRSWLEAARTAVLEEYPGLEVEHAAREWNPVAALIQESERARMIVVGSRGLGGFSGLPIGSTAVSLAAHGHCPIVVVRGRMPDDPPPAGGLVIVGADGSADSDAAVAFACDEASLRGAGVTAVHTWSEILADGTPGSLVVSSS